MSFSLATDTLVLSSTAPEPIQVVSPMHGGAVFAPIHVFPHRPLGP